MMTVANIRRAGELIREKARQPSHERSNTMSNITNEQTEDEIVSIEISDESLEAAAIAGNSGVYTQFGLCTLSLCPQ
jgi:hypothetical protein